MFRDLFQVVLPLLVAAGVLPGLDENPGRVRAFGIALLCFGFLATLILVSELSSADPRPLWAALRAASCLLGGGYLLVRAHMSRRESQG